MAGGRFRAQRYRPEYKPPGIDSSRAIAQATSFLVGARCIDQVTVDGLARQYRLKAKTAEFMLLRERQRRA